MRVASTVWEVGKVNTPPLVSAWHRTAVLCQALPREAILDYPTSTVSSGAAYKRNDTASPRTAPQDVREDMVPGPCVSRDLGAGGTIGFTPLCSARRCLLVLLLNVRAGTLDSKADDVTQEGYPALLP